MNQTAAARVMDLTRPTAKMGKSNDSTAGTIGLLDPPGTVRRTVMRAVTDGLGEVRNGPASAPRRRLPGASRAGIGLTDR